MSLSQEWGLIPVFLASTALGYTALTLAIKAHEKLKENADLKRTRQSVCKARQHSDQMLCECGLGWDMNDPEPPACLKRVVGRQALESAREILTAPLRLMSRKKQLLSLQEMPLRWLPADTLKAGLHTVTWASLPDASYVSIDLLRGREAELGRHYRFYGETGELLLEVRRVHTGQYQFLYRYPDGEWTHE